MLSDQKKKKRVVSTSVSGSHSSSTLRTITLIMLPLLSAAGFYGTWILTGSNGTVAALEALAKQDAPLLPGTTDFLLTKYTGVAQIDKKLTVLVTFFAPILNDNNGALKLFSIFGLGQFGAAWMVMMMESLRQGNRGRIVSFVGTFGFILQNITFVVTVPWWLFLHILTSPVASAFPGSHSSGVLFISKLDLAILPLAVTLGFIVPSVLMALPAPSVVSLIEHQQYIALWQPFPVWCIVFHMSIRYVGNMVVGSKENTSSGPQTALGTSYLNSSKHVYRFIIGICLITHLPALAITLLPPSAFSNATPSLQNLSKADFASVYLPYFPTLTHQVPSFAGGVHAFFQWDMYIGATAMLLWGVLLHRNAATEKTTLDLLGKIGFWTLLVGPLGALVVVLWERDEIVRRKTKQGS